MAKFELSIYGDDNEVIKKYEADRVLFKVTLEAIQKAEELKTMDNLREQIKLITSVLKKVFNGLTDEEIGNADTTDVYSTFMQICAQTNNINPKNA